MNQSLINCSDRIYNYADHHKLHKSGQLRTKVWSIDNINKYADRREIPIYGQLRIRDQRADPCRINGEMRVMTESIQASGLRPRLVMKVQRV